MKRFKQTTLFLALFVALMLSPVMTASAEEAPETKGGLKKFEMTEVDSPEDMLIQSVPISEQDRAYWTQFSNDYYYNQLTDFWKAAWDALEDNCIQIAAGTETCQVAGISLNSSWDDLELDPDDMADFFWIFKYSNPQYYFLDSSVEYSNANVYMAFKIYDEFQDGWARQNYTDAFCAKVNGWVGQVASAGREEDKVKLAHDIIACNTIYEFDTYDQSAYSMVCEGRTVCMGYANALQLLLNPVGIITTTVTSEEHAWNNVMIHGQWYAVDVTWDDYDGYYDIDVVYDYYLKSNSTIQYDNGDHYAENVWYGFLPELRYDSNSSWFIYYDTSYFTEGNYVYFKVNDNPYLAGLYALAVETVDTASSSTVPATVIHSDYTYSVLNPNSQPGPSVTPGSLNGLVLAADGNWYYYFNNEVATYYTGLVYDESVGWWFVRNGMIDFGYNGLWNDPNYGWWLVLGGNIAFDYNGLWNDPNCGWWLITNGTVAFDYTGLWNDPNCGWWLIAGGTVAFDYNGLWGDANYGWWLINGGTVAFDYTGLYDDPNFGWWLIGGGSVAFDYNGLWGDANYGWWLINGGTVAFDYTGLYDDPNFGWWLVGGGSVAFGYTGLWEDPNYGWWLIDGGSIAFYYTGYWDDPVYGLWYVNGGMLDFNHTDAA